MKLRIGDNVSIFASAKHAKDSPARKAKVLDLKWNLVYVHFQDGERECDWVDCRFTETPTKDGS